MGLIIDQPRPMEKDLAILCLVLNILPVPGIGTLIYNLKTGDDKWLNAIGQIVLSVTVFLWLLGFIWAVIDGVKILQAATPKAAPVAVQP